VKVWGIPSSFATVTSLPASTGESWNCDPEIERSAWRSRGSVSSGSAASSPGAVSSVGAPTTPSAVVVVAAPGGEQQQDGARCKDASCHG
jgi:hypothetical protein